MVLDPIPQSLPIHFFGSRPQPPTSRSEHTNSISQELQWAPQNTLYLCVLQCVAVCCSGLPNTFLKRSEHTLYTSGAAVGSLKHPLSVCVAVCCSGLPTTQSIKTPSNSGCCGVLTCVAVCCSVLQCVAVCCSGLPTTAYTLFLSGVADTHSINVLQCVAVCCSVLQ